MRSICTGRWFSSSNPSYLSDIYFCISSVYQGSYPHTALNKERANNVIPVNMYIEKLYMKLNSTGTNYGSGKGYTVTLIKNNVDTDVSLTFLGTDIEKVYEATLPGLYLEAGDIVKFRISSIGAPVQSYNPKWTFVIRTVESNYYPIFSGAWLVLPLTPYRYNYICGTTLTGLETDINYRNQICAVSGVIKSMYISLDASLSGTGSIRFTLFKNKIATSLTVDLAIGVSSANVSSDVTVTKGDVLSLGLLRVSGSQSSITISCGISIRSDTDGEFPLLFGSENYSSLSPTVQNRFPLNNCGAGGDGLSGTNIYDLTIYENLRLRDYFIELSNAPGVGKSWVIDLYDNTSTRGLPVTISDANKSGSNTTDEVQFSIGEYISGISTPSGTPTTLVYLYGGVGAFLDQIDEVLVDQEAAIACVNVIGSTISNLEHLEGKEVIILADGEVIEGRTVTNGQLVPPLEHSYATTHIGLRYDSDLVILPRESD